MKKLLFLLLLSFSLAGHTQVVNFAKTLPVRAYSIGLTPSWHFDRNVVLFEGGGPAFALSGGYGIQYDIDISAKYIYFVNGVDYIGVDIQYLAYEARRSYFSVIGGLHYWDYFGCDITGLFTYTPRYAVSFSGGLDLDLSFYEVVNPRLWVPLNIGFNVNDRLFLYAEYSMPVSERSWDIMAVGANWIIR